MEIFKDSIFDSVLIRENTVFIRENTSQRKPYSLILSLYVKIRVRQQRILAYFTQRHTVKNRQTLWIFLIIIHWVKRVRIRSYSGRHFSRIYPHSD